MFSLSQIVSPWALAALFHQLNTIGMKEHFHTSLTGCCQEIPLFFLLPISQLILLLNKVIHPNLAAVASCDSHSEECAIAGNLWPGRSSPMALEGWPTPHAVASLAKSAVTCRTSLQSESGWVKCHWGIFKDSPVFLKQLSVFLWWILPEGWWMEAFLNNWSLH